MTGSGVYYQENLEVMERGELEALQVKRLRQTLAQAAKGRFYKRVLADSGIGPDSIKSLDDLKRLPFTTKDNLRAEFPYGFLTVDLAEVVRVHVSSGTTGAPIAVYHTMQDLGNWAEIMARCLYMTGLRKTDVVQNMAGYGLFTGGLGLHYGAERLGCLVIPSGAGNSRRQIFLMQSFNTTAAHMIPNYAFKLLETFQEMGLDTKKDTRLRRLFLGAEPYTEQTRKRIQAAYGADVYNSYGLTEMNGPGVAFECPHKTGLHLWEDHYILEVVDPATLEPVPEGTTGELVYTTLMREAMPLIRYRSRDLAAVVTGQCACGRVHRRITRIKGRSDDMFILKGVNIYPMQVEAVLMQFKDVGNNYLIVLSGEGSADEMVVKVETAREMSREETEALKKRMTGAMRDELLVTPRLDLLPPGTLPTTEGKAVRVVDERR